MHKPNKAEKEAIDWFETTGQDKEGRWKEDAGGMIPII